jgi:hypothetical protein
MAGIGMYGVYYAKCELTDGVVTGYDGVQTMGKAISAEFTPNEASDNPLYANNAVAENDTNAGSGGTLNLTLDRLKPEAIADLYNLTLTTLTTESAGFDYSGNETSAPVGVAFIRQHQENGDRNIHEVVLFSRVTFSQPTENAQTLGESIEWQTPEITGVVYGKQGDGTTPWMKRYRFTSQTAAENWITSEFAAALTT